MELRRTANAGVLLKLDGISVLIDGVCREVKPYLATPHEEKIRLLQSCPDVLAFSHTHEDHCDPAFAAAWQRQTGRVILCPDEISGCRTTNKIFYRGTLTIAPVPSRHIGKVDPGLHHVSYIIRGSRCVWFLGDASPLQWKDKADLPCPDILIVPYAYAATLSAWEMTKAFRPKKIVLLHLPDRNADPYDLWQTVERTTGQEFDTLLIPQLGESLYLE